MYRNQHLMHSVVAQRQAEARLRADSFRLRREAHVRASRPDRPPPVARRRRRLSWA